MPLQTLSIKPLDEAIPDPITRLIARSQFFLDEYFDKPATEQAPGFVPSDFAAAYHTLRAVVDARMAPGRRFCEWGSGVGVVTLMATSLGLNSCGIEIEADLVATARGLAKEFNLNAEFVEGSFLPPDEHSDTFVPSEVAWLRFDGADGWEELALDPDEIDIVYAYPWPGEEHAIEDVFESVAADQALLITFHGREGLKVRRQRR